MGQTQKSECATGQSALPSRTNVASRACQVRNVPGPEALFVLSVIPVRQRVQTMGVRPLKQDSSLEDRLSHLLCELCVDWGFCIPPADAQRIASTKTLAADQFAHAVLTAEGFVAEYEKRWFVQIRQRFVDRFGQEIRAEDQAARVRCGSWPCKNTVSEQGCSRQ